MVDPTVQFPDKWRKRLPDFHLDHPKREGAISTTLDLAARLQKRSMMQFILAQKALVKNDFACLERYWSTFRSAIIRSMTLAHLFHKFAPPKESANLI